MRGVAKAITAAVSAGLAGVASALTAAATDGHITAVEIVVAVCFGVSAATGGGAAVYAVNNAKAANRQTAARRG